MTRPDVCLAGAGIVGLTLALALRRRGLSVLVLSASQPMGEASSAAAGMLAVDDPENPSELLPLSRLSRSLYPALLESLEASSGCEISFQTHCTLQAISKAALPSKPGPSCATDLYQALSPSALRGMCFAALEEESLDPRELAAALVAAADTSKIRIETGARVVSVIETETDVEVCTTMERWSAGFFVDCSGAWAFSSDSFPALRLTPRKGQMLAVRTPLSFAQGVVVRWGGMYLVPRLHGLNAGQTILGATVDDVGFDRSLNPTQLANLQREAAKLLPEMGNAPVLSRWSGFRPATQDLLPVLGVLPDSARRFIASGHYRNGILLAPGTAEVMAQHLLGEQTAVPLEPFTPNRFLPKQQTGD